MVRLSKMKLTKKRLRQLEIALCLDDVLHEKFLRLNDELKHETQKLYRSKRIINVYKKTGSIYIALQIEEMQVSPEGTIVIVKDT